MTTYQVMRKSASGHTTDNAQHDYRGEILVVAHQEAAEESATLDYTLVSRQKDAVAWLEAHGCEHTRAVQLVNDSYADLYAACEVANAH